MRAFILALALALLLAGCAAPSAAPARAEAPPMPSSAAIEERWGVRFTLVGVTADGGLIDLRYQVIDADRAPAMFETLETTPKILAADGSEIALADRSSHRHNRMQPGTVYFMLFRNAGNAIRSGDRVTIVVGDLVLEDVPAL